MVSFPGRRRFYQQVHILGPARFLWRDRARRAMRRNDESMPRAEVPTGRTAPVVDRPKIATVIVGGTDETRLLLRGLVRLHHHRVLSEKATAEELEKLQSV